MLIFSISLEFVEYRFALSKSRPPASKFGTESDLFNIRARRSLTLLAAMQGRNKGTRQPLRNAEKSCELHLTYLCIKGRCGG